MSFTVEFKFAIGQRVECLGRVDKIQALCFDGKNNQYSLENEDIWFDENDLTEIE
jgi:hypothetical protein